MWWIGTDLLRLNDIQKFQHNLCLISSRAPFFDAVELKLQIKIGVTVAFQGRMPAGSSSLEG